MLDLEATRQEIHSALSAVEDRTNRQDENYSGFFIENVVVERDPETESVDISLVFEWIIDQDGAFQMIDNGTLTLGSFEDDDDLAEYTAVVNEHMDTLSADLVESLTEEQQEVLAGLSGRYGATVTIVQAPVFTVEDVREQFQKYIQRLLDAYEDGEDLGVVAEIADHPYASEEQRSEATRIVQGVMDRIEIFKQLALATRTLDPKDLAVVADRDDLDPEIQEYVESLTQMIENA